MSAALTAALDGVAAASVACLSVLASLVVMYAAMWAYRRVLYIIGGGVMSSAESRSYFAARR